MHLVDFDEASTHNIHRQIAFKVGDEGKFKSEVVGELVFYTLFRQRDRTRKSASRTL